MGHSQMQSFQEQELQNQTSMLYKLPIQEFESYFWNLSENLDDKLCSDDDGLYMQFSGQASQCYSILGPAKEMSSYSSSSSSTMSYSADGSPISPLDSQTYPSVPNQSGGKNVYNSQGSDPCYTNDFINLKHKIREIETVLLGPEPDIDISNDVSIFSGPTEVSSGKKYFQQMVDIISAGNIKDVLVNCAKAVADNDLLTADWLMSELRPMVSVSGNPIQRVGAYMLEGLVAKLSSSGKSIYKALRCKEPSSSELLSYMHLLYESCPYFKFGHMSANGAIAEAMKNEDSIHIIDFQISEGGQWFTLIPALAARPGGPPRIRITGIDDASSAYVREGGLDIVGKMLSSLAQSFNVPFEFNAVVISGTDVDFGTLSFLPGEALAVNFAFMLHHMPDENVGAINQRDRILRSVKSFSPKVVTLVEQESNTNTPLFIPRFIETLNYNMALFESIDVTLPRDHKERINIEQHCLARDIVNVIACEGTERVERHELLDKWRARFVMAGFRPYPLSSYINATIKNLLENYSEHYSLEERDGALYLGWLKQNLVTSSAWR